MFMLDTSCVVKRKDYTVAGTRTAPTVDGLNTYVQVQLRWIDWTGDKRSDSYVFTAALATNANIETFAAAMQAGSNASLYEIGVKDVYSAVGDSGDASEEVWENVTDNLVLQAKQPLGGQSQRDYIPSPINAMFIENTDDIDPTNGALIAIIAAWVTLLEASYEVVGARFTSRRQINVQIPI